MFEAELKFISMRFLNPDKSIVANRVICDGNFRSFINMSTLSGHGPLRAKYKRYCTSKYCNKNKLSTDIFNKGESWL